MNNAINTHEIYDLGHALVDTDAVIASMIIKEQERQEQHIELIASENFVSKAVMQAQGSVLTNKYAEGYPGKRYYGGCQFVDEVEQLAIKRAMELFGAQYANVQPHSGSQANQAVFFATLKPGDTVLGLALDHGGHLTHGSAVNLSGKLFNFVHYTTDANGVIDYNQVESLAMLHRPRLIIAGASAYSLAIDFARFAEIAKRSGALLMVDMAHYAGLIAAGEYPSPIPYADFVTSTTHKTLRGPRGGLILAKEEHAKMLNSSIFPGLQGGPLEHVIAAKAVAFYEAMQPAFISYQRQVKQNARALANRLMARGLQIVSGGTDCHLLLVDLTSAQISGKDAEELLGRANITINKNSIPNDKTKPTVTSGIRLGTPAATTRGFTEQEFILVADLIADLLANANNQQLLADVKERVLNLCNKFPLYGNK